MNRNQTVGNIKPFYGDSNIKKIKRISNMDLEITYEYLTTSNTSSPEDHEKIK